MKLLLALPLAFCAGFLWTLGSDTARRVRIRKTRARTVRRDELRERLEAALRWEEAEREVMFMVGTRGAARWIVQ